MTQQPEQHEPSSLPTPPPSRPVTVAYASLRRPRMSRFDWLMLTLVLLIAATVVGAWFLPVTVEMGHPRICAVNLKWIGRAMAWYRTENEDMNPPDLDALAKAQRVDVLCPGSNTAPPGSGYIYVPLPDGAPDVGYGSYGPVPQDAGTLIIVFDLPGNHHQQTASFLCADGIPHETGITSTLLSDLQALNNYLAEQRLLAPQRSSTP